MAAATRIQKANHGDLYDARIKKQWMQGYGEPEHEFEQFYNIESIETEDMRWSYITGLGLWKLKPIGTNVTYDGIYQGKFVALNKPQVINGESLNFIRSMVTLCKQALAGQQQRLSPVAA